MGVREPAIIYSTTQPSQTSQPSGIGFGQIAYTTSTAPIPLHGVSPDVDLPGNQADVAPPNRETQPATPLRSRRRNCGNFILFLRLIAVLVSLATFAILIRYCVAQYGHGSMGGGVLGSLGVQLHLPVHLIPRMLTYYRLRSHRLSIGNRPASYGTRGTRSAALLPSQHLSWTQWPSGSLSAVPSSFSTSNREPQIKSTNTAARRI